MKQDSLKLRLMNDVWYGNLINNLDRYKSQSLSDGGPEQKEKDAVNEINFHDGFDRLEFCHDRDEWDLDSFGYTMLQNHQVACFDSGGEKLLCLPQVLDIIDDKNFLKIRLTIQKLGIVLIECSPRKMEILRQNRIVQSTATHCGLISQSNAERLCKIFKSFQPKSSDSSQILPHNYFIPLKYRHQIRVYHDCFGQQKGILMPQLCTNADAQCIECFDCRAWFSPSDFVGHTHIQSGSQSEMSTCHWGFTSSNWRLYLRLAEDSSRTAEEEKSLNDYLTEIKNRYIQPVYDSLTICNDHDQQTPSDGCSFNTSPSMPTPTSLSPSDGLNKIDLHNSSSIFQQCIMKICNNQLDNYDDRNQLISTLFMLRQEHHQQISTLMSERHELIKALKKSPSANVNSTTRPSEIDESKNVPLVDNSVNSTLQSVKQKIAILKRSGILKRKSSSPLEGFGQLPKTSNSNESHTNDECELSGSDNNQSVKEIIDCDSSSVRTDPNELLSSNQDQEMKND